ncbi:MULTISPECIES: DMT family transporter [Methylobacterium]|uniref:DMT family transporter n=1 Tax=Methylobacterium thuringiense TaxID=1003091 RepID=A0ABQ4TPP8_9HYPH|nr:MULTISPECIES: DMT family transporter [Methylobacterium]TXN20339.1 DMT family transporter [Methylobacterium sp. WL9]GJE56981.1 hypothetical protein EKPJFOCH_3491 [Methylobacterium thuringiense]
MAPFLSIGLYLAALLGGVAFVLQQTVNAGLRGALGSPFWAGLTNFVVGAVALAALLAAMREPVPSLDAASRAPWYAWTGGLLGVLYIVGTILLVPRLGAATVVGLFIVGQILCALVFDQFGLLGVPVREVGAGRLLGAALMIVGVGLVSAF